MVDYLQTHCKGSTIYGFRGGPAGVMKGKYVVLTSGFIYPYRNHGGIDMIFCGRDKIETPEQFKQAEETAKNLDLDGLVVIGGDDSNTNACLLAENFRSKSLKTQVIGCSKTIDGDLKSKEVPTSFGFDTACKVLVIAGGAAAVLREVSRHSSVELIDICDIDKMVVEGLQVESIWLHMHITEEIVANCCQVFKG